MLKELGWRIMQKILQSCTIKYLYVLTGHIVFISGEDSEPGDKNDLEAEEISDEERFQKIKIKKDAPRKGQGEGIHKIMSTYGKGT